MSDELVIGDWAYADEARYLKNRLEQWRASYKDPLDLYPLMPTTEAEIASLEKLLEEYIDAHITPPGQRRNAFQTRAALGLGYAVSIVIERWEYYEDYPFRRYARKSRR